MRYFESFTKEEIKHFEEVFGNNVEIEDEEHVVLSQPNADIQEIIFVKHNCEYYVECEESDSMFEERDNCIYLYDRYWWYKVDMEAILKDYVNGVEIDPNEYRIYE